MRHKGEAESPARGAVGGQQVRTQGCHSATTPEDFLCVPCACGWGGGQTETQPYEEGNIKQMIKDVYTCTWQSIPQRETQSEIGADHRGADEAWEAQVLGDPLEGVTFKLMEDCK